MQSVNYEKQGLGWVSPKQLHFVVTHTEAVDILDEALSATNELRQGHVRDLQAAQSMGEHAFSVLFPLWDFLNRGGSLIADDPHAPSTDSD